LKYILQSIKKSKESKMCLQNIYSHPAFFLRVVEVIPLRG
jgi:hypothetical protein